MKLVQVLVLGICLVGCGVAVRSDRAAIGGGPEQATAQARERLQATVAAAATANPRLVSDQPCDCDSTGK